MILHCPTLVDARLPHRVCRPLVALVALVASLLAGSAVGAQQGPASDRYRWASALTLDLGTIPDDFATQCGSGSDPSYGGGLSVLSRPRRWVVAAVDTRVSDLPFPMGCKLTIPAAVQIGPNEYENWGEKEFPNGVAAKPLVRNALHIGVETPPGMALLRATIGGGMIWSGRTTPFASMAIGGGSGGRGARFYWDLETSICAVRVGQTFTRYRLDSNVATPLPSRVVSYVEHPRWTALHVGLEIPVVSNP